MMETRITHNANTEGGETFQGTHAGNPKRRRGVRQPGDQHIDDKEE